MILLSRSAGDITELLNNFEPITSTHIADIIGIKSVFFKLNNIRKHIFIEESNHIVNFFYLSITFFFG